MTQYKRPDETVFASGAKTGEVENFPDIARGWGVSFDQTNGIPPMEWFNALFKRNDEALRYLMQRGIAEWSATEDYPVGAHVQESGKVWKAKAASLGKRPSSSPSEWVETALTLEALTALIQEQLGRIGIRERVRAASTTNLNLSGLQLVDGVNLMFGDRVLVKNQNEERENGIYVATTAQWFRADDADSSAKVQPGLLVHVESGATQSNSIWQLVTDGPITLGSVGLSFEMVAGYTGVATGTYRSLSVDRYGRVTAGTNPANFDEYGISVATQAEAEAGSNNIKAMTPLRVAQAIYSRLVQATESVRGISSVASQTQVNAGVDDATIVTPKKLRFGFRVNLGSNGYIVFPSWLGGLVIQWMRGAISTPEGQAYPVLNWPIAFPETCLIAYVSTQGDDTVYPDQIFQMSSWTSTTVKVFPQWFGTGTQGLVYPLILGIGK